MTLSLLRFYINVFHRASKDTLKFFDLHTVRAWLNIIIPALLVFIVTFRSNGIEALSTELTKLVSVAGASLAWSILVFAFFLLVAPQKMFNESQSAILVSRDQLGQLQESIKPRLDISFQPHGSCVQGVFPSVLYRVSVKNLSSSRSIDSVFVQLTDMSPTIPSFLPVRLHRMNDNPGKDGQFEQSCDLAPSEEVYFDCLEILHRPEGVYFKVKHIVRNFGEHLSDKIDQVSLTVRGKNCPSASANFKVIENANGTFSFAAA